MGARHVALAVLLALVLMEAYLRLPPFRSGISPGTYDPVIGYWHKSDFSGQALAACYAVPYSFDRDGLRPAVPGWSGEKAVVLGDSQVEAIMVPDDSVLHVALAEALDRRIEVLNYGLFSTSPLEQHVILERRVPLAGVRWVIQLVNLDTDIAEADPGYRPFSNRPRVRVDFAPDGAVLTTPPPPRDAAERLRELAGALEVYGFARKAMRILVDTGRKAKFALARDADAAVGPTEPGSAAWARLHAAFRATRALTQAHGITYLPVVWALDDALADQLVAWLDGEGIPALHLKNALRAQGVDPGSLTYGCDNHLTPRAHRLIARAIVESGVFER